MKKNIFKKIVASLATVAMAAGLFTAMPAEEAKAADPVTKIIYLVTAENDDNAYAASGWDGAASDGVQIKEKPFASWGNGAPYAATKIQDGLFKIQIKMWDNFSKNSGFQIIKYTVGADFDSGIWKAGNSGEQWTAIVDSLKDANTSEVWIKLSDSWGFEVTTPVTIKKTDAELAAEAEVTIDTAIALEATKDNKAAYEAGVAAYDALTDAQKALVDSAKVTKVKDGLKTINDAIAAEQAAEAAKYVGKLTIYAKVPASWEKVSLYGWASDDSAEVFGKWPGNQKLTEMKNNPGWYSCTFNMTEAIGVIFNNDGNKEQTGDWTNMKPGEYWVDFSSVEGTKDGDNLKYAIDEKNISAKAPANWKTESAQEVVPETEPVTEAPETESVTKAPETTGTAKPGDTAPVVMMLAVAAVAAGMVVASKKKTICE